MGAERLGAGEYVYRDLSVCVADGGSAGFEALLDALVDPRQAFLAIACAEFSEEFAEAAIEGFLDSHA